MESDKDDLQAPPGLVAALRESCKERIFVPPAVDAKVISRAREHLQAARPDRTKWPTLQWAAALAVLGLIAVTLTSVLSNRSADIARADFNGDGKVDVLDALALARRADAGGQMPIKWDLNSDGVVNRQDANAILTEVVALNKAGRS